MLNDYPDNSRHNMTKNLQNSKFYFFESDLKTDKKTSLGSKEGPETRRLWIWNNFRPKSRFEHKKSLKLRTNGHFLQIFGFQNAKIGRKMAENRLKRCRKVRSISNSGQNFFMWQNPKLTILSQNSDPPPKKTPLFFLGGGGGSTIKCPVIRRII